VLRLADPNALDKLIFDESKTVLTIQDKIADKPVLGFFQNDRIFQSQMDLDAEMRSVYGTKQVARLSIFLPENKEYAKQPQYRFHYSFGGCTISSAEAPVIDQMKFRM
jgi:hypothetical protein